jgi:alanyl-tRNA synthetase
LFKIFKEESISSGVRRIFALTGEGIIKLINDRFSEIENIVSELPEKYSKNIKIGLDNFKKDFKGADFRDVELMKKLLVYQDSTVKSLNEIRKKELEEKKIVEKQLLKQNLQKVFKQLDTVISESSKHGDINIIAEKMSLNNMDELNQVGEELRKKLKNGVGLIALVLNEKIYLVCAISDNLVKEKNLNAGKLISEVAKELGGGGGGRPHLATAGGKDVSKLNDVLREFPAKIKNIINQ